MSIASAISVVVIVFIEVLTVLVVVKVVVHAFLSESLVPWSVL